MCSFSLNYGNSYLRKSKINVETMHHVIQEMFYRRQVTHLRGRSKNFVLQLVSVLLQFFMVDSKDMFMRTNRVLVYKLVSTNFQFKYIYHLPRNSAYHRPVTKSYITISYVNNLFYILICQLHCFHFKSKV